MTKTDYPQLDVIAVGAHPDDADYSAGGSAALWRRGGHIVKMVSVTDGGAGHHIHPGPKLVQIRRAVDEGVPFSGPARYAGPGARAEIRQRQERASADTASQYPATARPRAVAQAARPD